MLNSVLRDYIEGYFGVSVRQVVINYDKTLTSTFARMSVGCPEFQPTNERYTLRHRYSDWCTIDPEALSHSYRQLKLLKRQVTTLDLNCEFEAFLPPKNKQL
jgi:hypothetical protein